MMPAHLQRYTTKWVVRLAYAHEDARYIARARTTHQRRAASVRYSRQRLAGLCRKLANRRLR